MTKGKTPWEELKAPRRGLKILEVKAFIEDMPSEQRERNRGRGEGTGSIWTACQVQARVLVQGDSCVSKSNTGRKYMGTEKLSATLDRMGTMVTSPAGECMWSLAPRLSSWRKDQGHWVTVTFWGTASATN